MSISRVSLVIIPFIILTMGAMFYGADINTGATYNLSTSNHTINGKQGNLNIDPISFSSLLEFTLIISVALAICIVMSIQVFGSGISGSVIPMVFAVTVLSAGYVLLSGLSFSMFMQIPFGIGFGIYFILILMYVVGLTGLVSTGGGD